MFRLFLVLMLVVGILIIGFASMSYSHLRELAAGTGSRAMFERTEVKIMTSGLLEPVATLDVATLYTHWLRRVYAATGVGLTLILVFGALLLQSLGSKRKKVDGSVA